MIGRHKVGASKHLFNPLHPVRSKWGGFCSILLVFTVLMLPLTLGFSDVLPDELDTIGLVIDFFFMADVLISCNTGYEDTDGVVVMDRKRAFNAYLQGWLIIDTLTAIPFDKAMQLFMGGGSDPSASVDYQETDLSGTRIGKAGKAMKTFKLIRLTRLAKILRIARLARLVAPYVKQFFGDSSQYETLIKLLSPIITVMFLSHYISGITFMLQGITFMLADLESFPDESWMVQLDLVGKPVEVQYFYGWLRSMFLLLGQVSYT